MGTTLAALLLLLVGGAASQRLTSSYVEANLKGLWESFKTSHGKVYTATEEEKRFEIFSANMREVVGTQGKNPHAVFGVSPFADLTKEEFKAFHSGLVLPEEGLLQTSTSESVTFTEQEVGEVLQGTDSIDYRTQGAITHVKNQGFCGGCWAFSAIGNIEAQWYLTGHPLVSLSEQELLSCDTKDYGCKGGLPANAMDWIVSDREGKITTEIAFPFVEARWNGQAPLAPCKTGLEVGAVLSSKKEVAADEALMLAALSKHGPLSLGVDANSWKMYQGGILTECERGTVDHAVLLVGYGKDPSSQQAYWIIKNSWGTAWGEAGYIRVAYGSNQCNMLGFVPVLAVTPEAPAIPQVIPDVAPNVHHAPNGELAPGLAPALTPVYAPPYHTPVPSKSPSGTSGEAFCIKGPCECMEFAFIRGRVGGDESLCNAAVLVPVLFGLACIALGAMLLSCLQRTRHPERRAVYRAPLMENVPINHVQAPRYHTAA